MNENPCGVVGCNKLSCPHWPVIQGKPLNIVLEEGHKPLKSFSIGEMENMKLDESIQTCVDLKFTHIRKLKKIDTVLPIRDRKLINADYKGEIIKWYKENSLDFNSYEDADVKIIRENLKVRNLSHTSLRTRNHLVKYFKKILVQELKYRRQTHIEQNGGHILEDVSSIVVDLLHLQVI